MTSIDWDAATAEATALLRAYIQVDTSNPPGNESKAVAFLERVLAAEGIASETAESAPGRSNLIARIGPDHPNVCLLNHTDVVPVERQFWSVDPFGGELREGAVWGRGALDMKGMGIIELMTMVLLKRQGTPLRRGVTFLAAADEEAGSAFGVEWLAEHRPGWLKSELVINEGAYGLGPIPGAPPLFQVSPTEKVPLWLKLSVRGRPGHASVPHDDNCADRLVAALGRIASWKQPLRLTPIMRDHVEAMVHAGLLRSADEGSVLEAAERNAALRARLSNTIVLTTITTGIKVNVIPAEATATLDCRLLPDVDVEEFLAAVRRVIADDRVVIEVMNRSAGAATSMQHEFVEAVSEVVGSMVEGAQIVPEMTSGFTDSRIYRRLGVAAFGFVPCLVPPEELAGIHGHNERISVENLRLGMQILHGVVTRLCAWQ
jgi:acetylornithine deacetylase/succinyl-diaminopimelate desuccinylase-like protein